MPSGTEDVTETFSFDSTMTYVFASRILDRVNIGDAYEKDYQIATDVLEGIAALDPVLGCLVAELSDSYTASDTITFVKALALLDAILAGDTTDTDYSAMVDLLDALRANDVILGHAAILLSDALQAGDSLPATAATIRKLVMLLDSLTAGDAYTNTLTLIIDEAPVNFSSSQELTAQLIAELIDYVDVFTLLKLPSELTAGVAMNMEGMQPISEYDNYNYNSLTSFKGKFYGASDTGLYELDGEDDGGAPINAEIGSMMLDFGSSKQKRVRTAYLGYTATNQLVLRVKSVSQGQLTEDWYEAREVESAEAPRANMVYVGQGLKSRYWQFELVNVDGGDFEIDLLEMYPIFLGRRV